ncbi:MAG: DNA polymerase, partial [Actinobacteria bacterium]|nr:DNA polymerase [Actinomycetota bacterium]
CEVTFDTELAAYLLNPGSRDLEFESLIESELGKPLRLSGDDQSFKPEFAGDLWLLRRSLERKLIEKDLLKLLLEIEIPLLKILASMEFVGVGFDVGKAEKIRSTFAEENEKLIASAHKLAGREFNVNSPKQLQAVLFDELKLPKTKKIKTGLSTDADSLNWLLSETNHPLLASLLRIREITKLQSVVEGLINSATKNRIRSIFQQAITSTGRLSSTEPNLQNIPVRSEEGRKIRDCFIAEPPFISLLTADYSQIEMRIMAHLSKDSALLEAFHSGEDLHATVASQVFGVKPSEVTAEMRRTTKAMSYGLAYGLSAFGLAQQLDLSPNEASDLMKSYFSRFGGIRDYLQSVVSEARDRGFTETLLGRRRYLPDLQSDNRQRREMAERMALNAPIQGSAADIIKLAMLRVERAIQAAGVQSRLILQVHDELIFEVWAGEERGLEELVRSEMAGAYPLDAELTVNVGIGRSWDEAAH